MMLPALALFALCACATAQERVELYDFGPQVGDTALHRNDDGYSSAISISVQFPLFGSTYTSLYVCTNGVISFGGGISSYTPTPFPIASRPVIAPFWGDVDIRRSGNIYFREVAGDNNPLLVELTATIVSWFGPRNQVNPAFAASWAYVVTWDQVPAYPGGGSATNTFQAVLITDGINSYVIYNYGQITWTYGSASGGVDAQVGFDAGDRTNFFALPSSRTPDVANVDDQTNVGINGRWMFRTDLAEIIDGGVQPSCDNSDSEFPCDPHQREIDEVCQNIAPQVLDCSATLVGPQFTRTEFASTFKFTCQVRFVQTNEEQLGDHMFQVRWLFNRRPDDNIEPVTFSGTSLYVDNNVASIDLNSDSLIGSRHLGKYLSCEVTSYFASTPNEPSREMGSSMYWMGVKAMEMVERDDEQVLEPLDFVEVYEEHETPKQVYLVSTLPIEGQGGVHNVFFPIYAPTTLVVKQNLRGQCGYDFLDDWIDEEQIAYNESAPLNIRTITSIVREPSMHSLIEFEPNPDPRESYWDGYSPASISVYRYDGVSPDFCLATGDPRIRTFDHRWYSMNAAGQFIMARSTSSRGFEVQVRTYDCGRRRWRASCVCGVAVREGNVVFQINRCFRVFGFRLVLAGWSFAWGSDFDASGWTLGVASTGRSISVETPSGSQVYIDWTGIQYNVQLHATTVDFSRMEGLCGNWDRDANNELGSASDLNDFVSMWRIPRRWSYFERRPYYIEPSSADLSYMCSCVRPEDAVADEVRCHQPPNQPYPPMPRVRLGIGITLAGGSTDGSEGQLTITQFTLPALGNVGGLPALGRRRRREIDPSMWEDYFDFAENSTNGEENTFPTDSGITQLQAQEYCNGTLYNFAATCGSVELDISTISDTIDQCIWDVRDLDSMNVADYYISVLQTFCLFDTIGSIEFDANENTTFEELYEQVSEHVTDTLNDICLNDCSHHGICENATCTCAEGWQGDDCSIDSTALPNNEGYMQGDMCDVRNQDCSAVFVLSDGIEQIDTLTCKIVHGRNEYTLPGYMFMDTIVDCELPESLYERNNPADFLISISLDGVNFGASGAYRVYDSNCLTCESATADCTIQESTCSVEPEGACFTHLERNDEALCYICNSTESQTELVFETGCNETTVGVGEWDDWSDYETCDVSCDYGWEYRTRSCLVRSTCTGAHQEQRLCINHRCDEIEDETDNGCRLMFEGSTTANVEQLLSHRTTIEQMGALRVNIYINQHRDDVCGLIGATAVASSLSFIETSHIGFAAGNWIIDTTNDVTTVRMFVKVARSELESACGASVVRRDADDIYLPREMIEAAMTGTEPEFLTFGLTLILVGEDVVDTSPEDSEEPEDSGDEESEETSSSSDNMGMIGMAVGFVMAALIVAGIVVAVLLIKKKIASRPVTPTNRVITDKGALPCKHAWDNPAPPSYDDMDGLAVGPSQAPPLKHTGGARHW